MPQLPDIEIIEKVAIKIITNSFPETEAIYIFGSIAKGAAGENSDIDLAFLSKEKISSVVRFQIQEKIALELNCDVNLIALKEASEVMQFQVVSEGYRIFERNEKAAEEYEDKVYYLYLDLCELRQPIIDNIKESGSIYG
jgi:predicted nucleotidyltransferase